jgi:serine protease AprX
MKLSSRRAARAASLLLAFLLVAASAVPAAASAAADAKLTGDLPAVLEAAAPREKVPVYFVLGEQLEGDALRSRAAALAGAAGPGAAARDAQGKALRRQATVRALREHAAQAQAGLLAALRELEARGDASRVRPLWIGNVVGADLTPDAVRALAARPEVARVGWNPKRDVFLGARASTAPPPAPGLGARYGLSPLAPAGTDGPGTDALECGVVKMRAPEVWSELGNTGEGSVVAVIDTGVCWTHPDIANQIWVNPGEDLNANGVVMDAADMNGVDDDGNGFIDDLIGWNFDYNTNQPTDENSHGSHCAGTVAGDGTGGEQTGMAPDAKIMVVRVGVTFSDEVDVWNAMQYAAANGADAISMSLGWPHGQNPDRPTWRTNCENTIDAGTAMVIAAGNEGSGAEPDNVRTPGDVPRVITVGATDCNDVAAGFSSRGPVTWQGIAPWNDWPYPPGLVKPDVSAPGVDTLSHNVCAGYSYKSGTSMATPHVAGAVALIVAANPGLEHDDIKALLEETAVDLGEPGKDNTYGTGRVDAYEAVLLSGSRDGRIAVKELAVRCGGTLNVTVSDTDLKNFGTIQVTAVSTTETAPESITLTETNPGSGAFKGVVPIGGGAPQADGVVQAADGDTVTVTYLDADNGAGGLNVPKTDSAVVDCSTPQISGVSAEPTTTYGAIIRWTTDEASDSLVEYGQQIPPDRSSLNPAPTTQHQVTLTGLAQCTIYRYRVSSTDRVGNKATDDNGGAFYYFEVMGDFGQGPQSCHAGKTTLDLDVYSCADTATLEVSDMDLNLNPGAVDGALLLVTSTTEPAGEWIAVTETAANSSRFRGTIQTAGGPPAADGRIQLADGDTLTVSYHDADDGVGNPRWSFDTAIADCVAPRITDLRVDTITDARATVRFSTEEPASVVVEWGTTPALGQTVSRTSLQTSHAILLNDFASCQRAYVRVKATDEHGYQAVADNFGTPHAFSLGLIPGLYWKESFEGSTAGWTLGGEWQVGAPQGRGGSGGPFPDPTRAYNNGKVLGHDLTGLGASAGDYEPSRTEKARSPAQNATTWRNTRLLLYRQLNSGNGDEASLWLFAGPGLPLYRSTGPVRENDYSLVTYDIASQVDGKTGVALEFSQKADASGAFSGWNVDEIVFKDGTKPDYGPCGGCAGAPAFAGAGSALDNDACGAGGVTVSWAAAPAWGTGSSGTYAIYRDTTPSFTPSPANRIAAGFAGLSYNDASAPDGALYYLVRAENDETCSSGPNNGGVTDGNTRTVPATNTATRPLPGAIGTLAVSIVGGSHLRLAWAAPADATGYRVYRSTSPQAGSFTPVGTTAGLAWDDTGRAADASNYFYTVRGTNPCGQEGP